eukprot:scaffold23964_cov122-Cylindrotheca_fusiformis.AAC.2
MRLSNLSLLFLVLLCATFSHGWLSPRHSVLRQRSPPNESPTNLKGVFDFLNPFETKIPEELRDEIYKAEANTPAAKDRGQRVAIFALLAFVGVLFAFFNGFLTELRATGPDGSPGFSLQDAGFGWVEDNFLSSFLLTNKIGGGICLLGGAGAGLLAEAELDSKRINAEKIYEELERRRNAKSQPKKKVVSKKKRRSGKETKRLGALSEVIVEEDVAEPDLKDAVMKSVQDERTAEKPEKQGGTGVMGGIKDLYNKADAMAASQALILNKQLEEAGMIDKITDETGLKVIGKEEAAKLGKGAENDSNEEERRQ